MPGLTASASITPATPGQTPGLSIKPPGAVPALNSGSNPSEPQRGDEHSQARTNWAVIISALVGGFLREIVRWKRLSDRKRQDLYVRPAYLAISVIEILLGIWVAILFAGLVAQTFKPIIAFVAGVGVEEVVRRAAKLKVWIPSVPLGEAKSRGSFLEYLRT